MAKGAEKSLVWELLSLSWWVEESLLCCLSLFLDLSFFSFLRLFCLDTYPLTRRMIIIKQPKTTMLVVVIIV